MANYMRMMALATTSLLTMGTSVAAGAQDRPAGATDIGIADIVVTAERRSEDLQDTSLSLDVIGAGEMVRQGISQPSELTRAVPSLQVSGDTNPQFYIRGVGDYGVTAVTNPAVSVYLDNVYVARPQGIAGNFYDLERVEVLRGPQGTLYGRNASGGVINVLTARPKLGRVEGAVNAEAGNFDYYQLDGAINLPVGERFAVRLAGQITSRDGYLSDGSNDDRHQSVRGRFLWEPSDHVSLLAGGEYAHLGGKGTGYVVAPPIPGQTDAFIGATDPRAVAFLQSLPPLGAPPPLQGLPGLIASPNPDDLGQDVESWGAFAQLDVDLGPATLTILPAYRKVDSRFAFVPSYLADFGHGISAETRAEAGGFDPQPTGIHSDTKSLEVRLGGQSDLLNWVVGVYHFDEDVSDDLEVYSGFIQHIRIGSDLGTRSNAGFAQVDVNLSEALRLQGGIRYTSDRRSVDNGTSIGIFPSLTCPPFDAIGNPVPPPANFQCPIATFAGEKTFKKFTWRAGVELDVAPENMVFANVSTGFKAGGFSEAADFTVIGGALPYEPETITAFTLGSRNRFLNNRLQLNIEGFYWQYNDLQVNQLIIDRNGNVALGIQNADRARVYGANVDLTAKPYARGTLRFSLEYLNSRYNDFTYVQSAAFTRPGSNTACAAAINPDVPPPSSGALAGAPFFTVDCSGRQLIRAPKWSGSGSYTHIVPFASGAEIALTGDFSFGSSRWLDQSFIAAARAPAYQLFGASVAFTDPGKRWTVTGFIRNITKEAVYTGGQQSPFVDGFITSTIAAPRTYGVRMSAKY